MNDHQMKCRVSCLEFCVWMQSARPGSMLEYHQGSLAVDADPGLSKLPDRERQELCEVRHRAFSAAAEGAVKLVQRRIGPNNFSYLAIRCGRLRGQFEGHGNVSLTAPKAAASHPQALDGQLAAQFLLPLASRSEHR